MSKDVYICVNTQYCGIAHTDGQLTPQYCLDIQKAYAGHYYCACMKKVKEDKLEDERAKLKTKGE